VLHQIGVGALGPVFRTYEPERDRLVAVKAFRLDITPEQAQTLADELSRTAEAALFHPSIVEPIAAGVEGTVAYCAEEYVAAESLDVAMRHYAPAPIATVLPFITQLAGAIDFARAAGLGHGALHPRDIFVTPEEARATGFGVVEALERVGLRAPVRRPYSPPERIGGTRWDTTADVFSLAAITFELLTGRRPAGLGAEIGPLTAGTPNSWMDALHTVLTRAMESEPSARYPTALAFAAALEAAGRGELAVAPLELATDRPFDSARPRSGQASFDSAPPRSEQAQDSPAPRSGQAARSVAPVPPAIVAAPDSQISRPADVLTSRSADVPTSRPADVPTSRPADPPTTRPSDPDILAERDEDEAEEQLRIEEAAAPASSGLFTDLDDDVAAEAEADRFVADDFLLDAAGAATAAPEPTVMKTPLDPLAFEDDEVMVKETPSFEPRDRSRNSSSNVSAASSAHVPPPVYMPSLEEPAPARSALPTVLLVVLALVLGVGGGWFLRGRVSPAGSPPSQAAAMTGTADTNPAPGGREFSEQAVAPAAKPGVPATPPAANPGAAAATASREPAAAPRASTAKAAPAPAATGTLTIRSTPNGAGVTLNGQWRGRTPLTIENLPLRRYDLRVVQQGFEPATQAVSLTSATPDRSLTLRLERASPAAASRPAAPPPQSQRDTATSNYTGSVYVDSRPRGARVSIDGRAVGVTPVRIPDVRIGSRIVRLELPDHRIWSSTTTVVAGQESRVTGSLERIQ
jgi:serine/threonine protein kinase